MFYVDNTFRSFTSTVVYEPQYLLFYFILFLTFCWPCISVINQLDAQNLCFTISLFQARGCVMQFWPPVDEHMCSKHVEAWNKLIVKQKFCASSWLITEINAVLILALFNDICFPQLQNFACSRVLFCRQTITLTTLFEFQRKLYSSKLIFLRHNQSPAVLINA